MEDIDLINKMNAVYGKYLCGDIDFENANEQIGKIQLIEIHRNRIEKDNFVMIYANIITNLIQNHMFEDIKPIDHKRVDKCKIGDKYVSKHLVNDYVNNVVNRIKYPSAIEDICKNEVERMRLHDNLLKEVSEERGSKWARELETYLDEIILDTI